MIVVVVPEVALVSVNVAVEVPVMAAVVVIVVVVLTGRVIVDVAVAARPAKVFAPVTVSVMPAKAVFRTQLNVDPPPAKVLAADVGAKVISPTPVPAVVVNPDGAALLKVGTFPPVTRIDPPLNVMFFVPAAVVKACGHVTVLPFRSTVPLVRVN